MAAMAAINALPDRVTLADEHLVIAARAAYNKISSVEQQALVTEYLQKLVTAENLIKAYKNSQTTDEPVISDTPTDTKNPTKTALIVLCVIEAVEILGVAVLVVVGLYLKRKKKLREALLLHGERKTVTVKRVKAEETKTEETEEEIAKRLAEYEKRAEEANAKYERNRKIRNIAVSVALLTAILLAVAFVTTKCSKDTSPYGDYENNGYNVSVKYDANGGIFTTNTSTLVDTYNLENLPDGENGTKLLTLIDPSSEYRGNQSYLAAKVGYHLAGWFVEKTEVTDENGNVIGYTYSGKWDFASSKYAISADANYDPQNPVLTLYAAWVPSFTYEFYSVDESGNVTLLGQKSMNPMESTEITLPAYNSTSGLVEIGDFPYLQNNTYSAIYTNEACTEEITSATISHIGTYNSENATVENATMKVYCKLLDGVHVRVDSADKLINNANLSGIYILEGDLDFSGKHWPDVFTEGAFSGKIIGNGHTIKNVTVNQTNNSTTVFGLFGQISEGAAIENVTFDNITVNVKAGSRLNEPKIGIIAGVIADGTMNSVKLRNSSIVVYTKKIASGTIVTPEYGLVCAYGSVEGVDFSQNCGVKFSRFDDLESVEQVEYDYAIDFEGRFTLSLKESAGQ